MTLLQRYRKAEAQLVTLLEQRKRLSEDPALQRDLEFEQRLLQLLAEYRLDRRAALGIVRSTNLAARRRIAIQYRHPSTGEVLEDIGDSAARLAAWRLQYGSTVVDSWKESCVDGVRVYAPELTARSEPSGTERGIPHTSA